MSELDKLESYLAEHGYDYRRFDDYASYYERHQIEVYKKQKYKKEPVKDWDAICQQGSYGYDEGLLEIYGSIVDKKKDGDVVVGWLTAEDVIERIENR